MCNTNITCSMEHILQASLHHTLISDSTTPLNDQNINFTVQHMTGVGVFRFINREITRGQGFVWHVSVCYNTNRHGCLSLGQKPYGLQQLINIFVDVKQDFYILHLDLLYLALQHLGHIKISSVCCGYEHLETPFSHRVGFLKGKVCVPIMNYNLHFQ